MGTCSYRGPWFGSQHPHGSSQPEVTPVLTHPLQVPVRNQAHIHTLTHVKLKKKMFISELGVVVHTLNLSFQEAEAAEFL